MVSLSRILLLFVLYSLSLNAYAGLVAAVSQQRISEGDTLTFTLTATDQRGDETPDFGPLTRDFVILSQQQSNTMSITNGRRSSSTAWQLSLLAKSTGALTIPSLQLGQDRSRPIAITVKPAAKNQTVPTTDSVLIESSLSRDSVYLGGQSLLTVRIIHRGNLINASLTEPVAENATIQQTHESSYQRTIDGTPVAVIERVYAVFPEVEGTLSISAQTLQAELAMGSQRSVFGYTNTKTTRRNSKAQTLKVLGLPEFATGKDTVTADNLIFQQQWSDTLSDLQVGDSITRTLVITATGATAAQIPPLFLDDIAGIKIYGDQPNLNDASNQLGVIGTRTESTAYVLTRAGTFEIPAVVIYWVHAQTGKVQSVSVPSTQLNVKAAESSIETVQPIESVNTLPSPSAASTEATATSSSQNPVWFYSTLLLLVLWLITLVIALRLKYGATPSTEDINPPEPNKLFKTLLLKAKTNDTAEALQLFNQWGRSLDPQLKSNAQICAYLGDNDITKSIQRAERSLYQANEPGAWNGATLVSHLKQWQQQNQNAENKALAPLYK